MNKNIIRNIVLAKLFVILLGCDNYLDHINPNSLSSEAIGQSDSDLEMLLFGCYDGVQQNFVVGYRFLDAFTDVGYGEQVITEGGGTPQTNTYLKYWSEQYKLIVRCNELISNISEIDAPSQKIKMIEGEAKFLRALGYYYLTVLFKDVPLIINRQSFDERFVLKNSQEEIKAQIIQDLNDAISQIPKDNTYPRVTKGAALTLKARLHAYFREWNEVLNATDAIIKLNKYSLYPSYETLFSEEAEGNEESIFAVAFATGMGEGEVISGSWPKQPVAMGLRPFSNYADAFYCTDGLPISESPLYNPEIFYQNRDPRYEVSILRKGEIWSNGKPYEPGTSVTGYSSQKYSRITTEFRFDGPNDFMILRFADVLLMRAEALVESNDTGQEVYNLIDQVRARVNMPPVSDVEGNNLSKSQLIDVIRHERFVEFGQEGGIRWFDIKRWNIVEEVYQSIVFHNRPFLGDKTLYWPIPQVEIDNNPNLVQHDWWN